MQTIVDQLDEMTVSNLFELDGGVQPAGFEDEAEQPLRAAAWEQVAERHTPAGLRFRW